MTTAREIVRPKIFRVGDDEFYVESSSPERKFCYRVVLNDEEQTCTCGDFSVEVKKDPKYRCEHILAVVNYAEDALDFEQRKPKLDDRFITNIQGKDFVVYSGILDLAHQQGLKAIEVKAVQFPTEENGFVAICKATVESHDGETFVEVGDANPKNVNSMVVRHILRVAATRAKARALRDFTNIGMTCLEELDDLDDIPETKPKNPPLNFVKPAGKGGPKKPPVEPPKQEPKENPEPPKENSDVAPPKTEGNPKETKSKDSKEKFTAKLSSAQLKAIENLAKRRGMTPGELGEVALETFGRKSLDALTQVEASSLIRTLQQSA